MEAWRQELYLAHHGIKGQRWGIRRYQNPDGSLTEAGRKRFRGSEDYTRAKVLKKKGINNLTNEEFRFLNERLQLEQDYKKYTTKGESYAKKVMIETGAKVISTVAVSAIAYAGAKYVAKKYNITPETVAKGAVDLTGRFASTLAKESAKAASSVVKEGTKTAGAAVKEGAKTAGAAVKEGTKTAMKDIKKSGREGLKNFLGEEEYYKILQRNKAKKRGGK